VGNGENPNDLGMDDVGEKDLEVDPAVSLGTQSWQLGMVGDPGNGSFRILLEADAQPGFNGFIACDGISKLICRLVKNPEIHAG
jgi:hypothetical protein